jgi:hypothetical protein
MVAAAIAALLRLDLRQQGMKPAAAYRLPGPNRSVEVPVL